MVAFWQCVDVCAGWLGLMRFDERTLMSWYPIQVMTWAVKSTSQVINKVLCSVVV